MNDKDGMRDLIAALAAFWGSPFVCKCGEEFETAEGLVVHLDANGGPGNENGELHAFSKPGSQNLDGG